LFQRLGENVRLKAPGAQPALVEAAQDAAKAVLGVASAPPYVSPVERHFKGLLAFAFGEGTPSGASGAIASAGPLAQYLEQLRALQMGLRQLSDGEAVSNAAFVTQFQRASLGVERVLAGLERSDRLAVERFLTKPLRVSELVVEGHDASLLTDKWRAEVLSTQQRLTALYPFNPAATSDVPWGELAAWLAPESGTFWTFFDAHLQPRVELLAGRFSPRTSRDRDSLERGLLRCLDVAREIQSALLAGGTPNVPFAVKLSPVGPDVTSVTFAVDGQSVVYRNEPERWQSLEWPGKAEDRGASITVRGPGFADEIRRSGEFGLVRLLSEGELRSVPGGGGELQASWPLRRAGTRVEILLRPASEAHPFRASFFERLRCPAQPLMTTVVR
jgi:type VI secretion system protein ImpL